MAANPAQPLPDLWAARRLGAVGYSGAVLTEGFAGHRARAPATSPFLAFTDQPIEHSPREFPRQRGR